jgi:uncharacterized integral membrane protein
MIFVLAVVGVVMLGVVALFSIQNAAPVTVWFYNWQFSASLAVVVFLSVLTGMVVMALFSLSLRVRRSLRNRAKGAGKEKAGPAAPSVTIDPNL